MNSPDVFNNQLEIYLCEQYGISWITWSPDGWIQNQYGSGGTTFWPTFVQTMLGGPFTSNYVSSSIPVNQTITLQTMNAAYGTTVQVDSSFQAYPFNIWNGIASATIWGDSLGANNVILVSSISSYMLNSTGGVYRVQDWSSGAPLWGTVSGDSFITLSNGQTTTVSMGSYSSVRIFAWANSPVVVPLINAGNP